MKKVVIVVALFLGSNFCFSVPEKFSSNWDMLCEAFKARKPDLAEKILKNMVSEKCVFSSEDLNFLNNMLEARVEKIVHIGLGAMRYLLMGAGGAALFYLTIKNGDFNSNDLDKIVKPCIERMRLTVFVGGGFSGAANLFTAGGSAFDDYNKSQVLRSLLVQIKQSNLSNTESASRLGASKN
jgi:hypothetical protein